MLSQTFTARPILSGLTQILDLSTFKCLRLPGTIQELRTSDHATSNVVLITLPTQLTRKHLCL